MSNARDKANIPALNFSSTGIDDNATSTAITIDSGGDVTFTEDIITGLNKYIDVRDADGHVSGRIRNVSGSGNSLTIESDPNNSGASTFLSFKLDTSEKMRIDSSGNVGIGTSSPDELLSLEKNNAPKIQYKDTSGGTDAKVWRTMGLDSDYRIETRSDNLSNGQLAYTVTRSGYVVNEHKFFTSDSERMRIDSLGRVGIGESSPISELHITDSSATAVVRLESSDTGDCRINFDDQSATDRGRIIYAHSDDSLRTEVNASERMRIHSNGHVGIGTTASTADLELETTEKASGTNLASGGICLRNSGTVSNGDVLPITGRFVSSAEPRAGIGFITETQDGIAGYGGAIGFYTLGSADGAQLTSSHERVRIDKSGNVLIGMTSTSGNGLRLYYNNNGGSILFRQSYGNGYGAVFFQYQTTQVGSIYTYTNSTSYNTSSDYRLKENVSYDFDATSRLKQLKPARFNFTSEPNKTVDGFLAHEVSSVVPEAITGEKDAVKEDGTPDYQGIDQSKLVPLLVKTIQELEARITALETNQP